MNILGVDPGRAKTGLAVIDGDGHILWRAILAPTELGARLPRMVEEQSVSLIALGDSTSSRAARAAIEAALPHIGVRVVDESGSTLEARALYWADHPRAGWRALVPLSLQEPPEPIDDYAAAVVARRALSVATRS